jgi:hypothetical protein
VDSPQTTGTAVGFESVRARAVLIAAIFVAAVRVLAYGFLDTSVHALGSEASDLHRAMLYHQALHGHGDFFQLLSADSFKPPLWYAGFPALLAGLPTLTPLPFLTLNALCLIVAAGGVVALAGRVSPGHGVLVATLLFLFLPGVAGRVTNVGVEPVHMAAMPWAMWLLIRGLERAWRHREAALFGLLLGTAVLAKWTIGAYLLPAFLLLCWWSRGHRLRLQRLVAGGALAGLLFGLWAVPMLNPAAVALAVGSEPVPIPSFYVRDLAFVSLGVASWPVLVLVGRQFSLPTDRAVVLLSVTCGWIVLLHTLIPHKEGRYLLPMFPLLAVLLARALSTRVDAPRERKYVWAAVGLVVFWSFFGPAIAERVGGPLYLWTDQSVFLRPDTEPQPSDVVLTHPILISEGPTDVAFISGPSQESLRLTVAWELYSRNASPVRGLGPLDGFSSLRPGQNMADIDRLIALRELTPVERATLGRLGFVAIAETAISYPGEPRIELWCRGPCGR